MCYICFRILAWKGAHLVSFFYYLCDLTERGGIKTQSISGDFIFLLNFFLFRKLKCLNDLWLYRYLCIVYDSYLIIFSVLNRLPQPNLVRWQTSIQQPYLTGKDEVTTSRSREKHKWFYDHFCKAYSNQIRHNDGLVLTDILQGDEVINSFSLCDKHLSPLL